MPHRPTDIDMLSRRGFVRGALFSGVALSAATPLAACSLFSTEIEQQPTDGRLLARPTGAPSRKASVGITRLNLASRDAELYVPAGYDGTRAVPLLVLLHGAGRDASEWTSPEAIRSALDTSGIAMLAPSSRLATWSAGQPDVTFIDRALRATFDLLKVDTTRLGIGGFSDGASFGLSLGVANGDFFQRALAYSAGYLMGYPPNGQPKIFMSHGTADPILPYAGALNIADILRKAGYTVEFATHDGGHTIGPVVLRRSFDWFLAQA